MTTARQTAAPLPEFTSLRPVHRGGSSRVEAVALVLVVLVLGGVLIVAAL